MVSLTIQNIEREPLGARKYMGPERYIVNVSMISLKPVKTDAKPVDYQSATITIRKNTASLYGWSVDSTSGIRNEE